MPKYGNISPKIVKKSKIQIRQPSEPVEIRYYEAISGVKLLVLSKVQNSPISDTRSEISNYHYVI